jgi:Flp pilus assembly protein TadG
MALRHKGTNSSSSLLRLLGGYARDQHGNVAAIVAILIIPLIGVLALAGEISTWYTIDRSLQNASDAAAVAAATNNDQTNDGGGMPRYRREAFAVASQYGFVSGTNNVTITATPSSCPNGANTGCYQVTISKPVPVLLSRVLGFTGNTTLNGGAAETIAAKSIATTAGTPTKFCIVTLGGSGISSPLLINGGPKTDLNGCSTVSNGSATCHGQPIGNIGDSYAIGPTNDCAPTGQDKTISSAVTDPYAGLASQIPPNNCPNPTLAASYPQEPKKGFTSGSPNLIPANTTYSGTTVVCGDQELNGTLTLTAGTLYVIENGELDLNGNTVNANGATIIFTGPTISGLSPSHFPVGGGTMNLTAPTSGSWADVSLYQDPALPAGAGVDVSNAGNTPTWNLNGVVDFPNSNITISGAVNKGVTDCFGLVALSLTINGTGSIANDAGCGPITIPGLSGGSNVALVQ